MPLTKIGGKRKIQIPESVETLIIWAHQSFEIAGRLNLVQIEIDDDRVLNLLQKFKNASYKLTPLRILFPASVKNDTEQIFIICRELNDTGKSLINSKIYGLLGKINIKKINNWEEIKAQFFWVNATLQEQKETNNSRHICVPFVTSTLNDLLSFSINLIDYNNKDTTFEDNEKKISILNFQIDVFQK